MGLLEKVKEQAEQTAARARDGVEDMQAKRELSQAYTELGKTAFALLERGEISHPELNPPAAHIRELSADSKDGSVTDPDAS